MEYAIWDIQPGFVAVRDPLEGLDVYDALSEGVISLDDLPVSEQLIPQEQEVDESLTEEYATETESLDVAF